MGEELKGPEHCTLGRLALDGHRLGRSRPLACSTGLVDLSGVGVLVRGRAMIDPATGRTLPNTGGASAIGRRFALVAGGPRDPLVVVDRRTGKRSRLAYPSPLRGLQAGTDDVAVERNGNLFALTFGDPAFEEKGQSSTIQAVDMWALDPATHRLHHLPDMPASAFLKATKAEWTTDGRLVIVANDMVGVWRPGDRRIATRSFRLPTGSAPGGTDSIVVWQRGGG